MMDIWTKIRLLTMYNRNYGEYDFFRIHRITKVSAKPTKTILKNEYFTLYFN